MNKDTYLFEHTSLDLSTHSIRLLEILPTERDGVIQCRIRPATIDSKYSCLSYVWGPRLSNTHAILINGHEYHVRENLYDFLHVAGSNTARRKISHLKNRANQLDLERTWLPIESDRSSNNSVPEDNSERFCLTDAVSSLWIDAICIDQGNVIERNHQVKQMGNIFANAQYVISWFGSQKRASGLFNILNNKPDSCRSTSLQKSAQIELYNFLGGEYWRRAWITQEIGLARLSIFLSRDEAITMEDLSVWKDILCHSTEFPAVKQHTIDYKRDLVQFSKSDPQYNPRSLLSLLWEFGDKECYDRRDAVYSLLSICDDATQPTVDYDMSVARVAYEVFKCAGTNFCLCDVKMVFRALGIREYDLIQDLWHLDIDHKDRSTPFVEIRIDRALQTRGYRCGHCVRGSETLFHTIADWYIQRGGHPHKVSTFCLGSCNDYSDRHSDARGVCENRCGHLLLLGLDFTSLTPENMKICWIPINGADGIVNLTKKVTYVSYNPDMQVTLRLSFQAFWNIIYNLRVPAWNNTKTRKNQKSTWKLLL